jgi:predicted alpha/beta-hydrolase family hydrolase
LSTALMPGCDVDVPAKALFLTPGSGGSADHVTLVQLESELTRRHQLPVVRYDFEYRRAGKKSPGRADRLIGELCTAVMDAARSLGIGTEEMVIGGRSMGGRVCSMAVAGGLETAGLLLLSYPLHPPGKPEALRVDHWPSISVPSLFVSGENDQFGRPNEFDAHLGMLSGDVSTVWLPGGGHDPKTVAHRAAVVTATEVWLFGSHQAH